MHVRVKLNSTPDCSIKTLLFMEGSIPVSIQMKKKKNPLIFQWKVLENLSTSPITDKKLNDTKTLDGIHVGGKNHVIGNQSSN